MELNEIKKLLYKEKPIAKKTGMAISPNTLTKQFGLAGELYEAETSQGIVQFLIPKEEMGNTPFNDEEKASLLIRWIL